MTMGKRELEHVDALSYIDCIEEGYERLSGLLFGDGARARLIGICAEPGSGRGDLVTHLLNTAFKAGFKVSRHNLVTHDASSASDLVVRVARRSSRQQGPRMVAFDELPPSDESCVRRQARALRRMWEAGVFTVFSLAPEAGQLLEALPESTCVGACDLVAKLAMDVDAGGSYWLRRYTRGIPLLIKSLPMDEEAGCDPLRAQTYLDALLSLVGTSLRLTLSDDDLRLRLAMLLLGHGSNRDLLNITGDVSGELIEGLRTNAPFFEIGVSSGSFSSPLDIDDSLVRACRAPLSAACALFPDICESAIEVLAKSGRFGRVAELLELPGSRDKRSLLLESAPPFLDAGAIDLVKSATCELAPYTGLDLGDGFIRLLDVTVGALGGSPDARQGVGLPPFSENVDSDEMDLALFIDARRVLSAERAVPVSTFDGLDALGRRLLVHREVSDLMVEGRFSAAMRLLVANPCGDSPRSVSESLLKIDAEIARLLLCDASTAGERSVARAAEVLSDRSLTGLAGYVSCLSVIRAVVMADDESYPEVDLVVSRAERAGDRLVQAIALVGGAVIDLRRGALARAAVRAELARAVSSGARLGYLARIAALLNEAARFLLGEAPRTQEERDHQDDLGRVCALVRMAMLAEEEVVFPDGVGSSEPPRDAAWLLLVLGEGMGALSSRLAEMMPLAWRHALSVMRPRWKMEGTGELLPMMGRARSSGGATWREGEVPMEICLLGGFVVTVRGRRIPDHELEHRNAKSMLEYLVLQRGATAKRYQLVEQVWPDADYGMGFNRAYQATSTLRAAIARVDQDLDPFVLSRATKAVSLDMGLIRCDVDEFRVCAREASDGSDDEKTVAMARRAERLYTGDLYIPPVDATGYIAATRDELRRLYGDAMVAGSDAALRLGKKRTATRLAMNALSSDDMREDAVIAMVRAMRASGRNVEADRQYQRYARRLMQMASRPPSRLLRRAAGMDEGPRARPSRTDSVEVSIEEERERAS